MFYAPIRHTPLKTVKAILDFSCDTDISRDPNESKTKIFFQKDSAIFICAKNGKIFVTPYRDEIPIVLKESGFSEEFFDGNFLYFPTTHSYRYCFLAEMAKREKQFKIYEENFKKSPQKNSSYTIPENLSFSRYEITRATNVGINIKYKVNPMFSGNDDAVNISTFIVFNGEHEEQILLCDEYGRTFYLTFDEKDDLYSFVNFLLDTSFSYNCHPEKYIYTVPKE